MAYQAVNTGSALGDHTGDNGRAAFTKVNANFVELYTLAGGTAGTGYLAKTLSAASTNDYDPGGGFPTSIVRLDITTSVNDNTLTGLLAGTDGQQLTIRNIGATFNLILTVASGSSSAANQFYGQGTAKSVPPGSITRLTYYSLPNPRWAIG